MQPKFIKPEFLNNNSAEEIHERMMKNLPEDIDDMPGGFPYDFTMPSALEKSELVNFQLTRSLMISFPEYAWDSWLDLHGQQVNLSRHPARYASGKLSIKGVTGAVIKKGTVFCTTATEMNPSIEFKTDEECIIGEDGTITVPVTAMTAGINSNVVANSVTLMLKPDKAVKSVTNPEKIIGGTEIESNDDFYDRIAEEYANSRTYLGNDNDYIRWSKEAGAGECVVIPAAEGPGTVKLALIDGAGQPANEKLISNVYNYIVSPNDRSKRILPTACSKLICEAATMVSITYTCTGLKYGDFTNIGKIKAEFEQMVKAVYKKSKSEGVLRYNDIRPLISDIPGVYDFDEFLINGSMHNIDLMKEEYPETGLLIFQ